MGYNNREQCIKFIKSPDNQKNWNGVKILVFDAPLATEKPYFQRLEQLQQSTRNNLSSNGSEIPQQHAILSVVKPVVCSSRDSMKEFYYQVCQERPVDSRAEGVILRDPTAWYFKQNSFLKIKVPIL
jgi:hypothetical protein